MIRAATLAALSVFSILPAFAQETGRVSGYVLDAESGETLLVANVAIVGTAFGTATNGAGFYMLSGIPEGDYQLRASYVGYAPLVRRLTIHAGETLRLDLELRPLTLEFEAVVVEAERTETEDARQLSLARLPTSRIAELPSILEPDVFRSLQLLPGIKAASDYSSGLYIRGGTPDQTLILLDETTVYNPSHFLGFFSTFNADALKDVGVYKGGYPAEFGGRIGSVVDLHNRDGNRRQFHGRLSLGLLASRALLEGPFRSGSYMVAFRRTTLEPLLGALRDQDIDGIPDQFYFYDLNAKLNVDASPNDRLSFAAYLGLDKLSLGIVEDSRFHLQYGNRTLSAQWRHILSGSAFSSVTVTSSHYFSNPRFDFAGTEFTRDNRVDDVSVKPDLEVIFPGNYSLKVGIWAGLFTLRLQDRFDGDDTFSEKIQTGYASAYAQTSYRTDMLSLVGGVRFSYFGKGRYSRIEPRLSADYRLGRYVRLLLSAGRYHQFLTLITNEAFAGFDVWLTTADAVPPAYGDQAVAGVKWRPSRGFRLDVEAYYRTMRRLFELDPFIADAAGLSYADFFQFGSGWASGIEIFAERSVGRIQGFVGYTFGATRRKFPNLNGGESYAPKFDRTHDLKAVVNFGLGRRWRLTAAWSYATGQAYTEPASQYRLVDFPFTTDPPGAIVSPFNRARLPAYHRLDLGFEKQGRLASWGNYTLRLQVMNVYARENIWFYFFEFETDRSVDRTTIPQIPVPIPNISFTVDFQ